MTKCTALTYNFAKDQGVVVLDDADIVTLGLRPDAKALSVVEARRVVRRPVRLQKMDRDAFDQALSSIYAAKGLGDDYDNDELGERGDLTSLVEGIPQTADLLDSDDDAPVIRLINGLIFEAINRRASDIHIEPYEDKLSIRYRIDGVLQEVLSPSRRLAPLLVSRIKVMARLDIAEKRVPQDGRISLSLGGRSIDVRVSTLPSRYGERVVMRLLDKQQANLDLNQLGMSERTTERFRSCLRQPNGIILVTGPTGSGKTTTLYSAITLLNDNSRNILTVEDPVEYGLDGIGQTQVNTKVGMTFAAGLRAILRQDPDVVMVGEIRDAETAEIAVQSALTGHIVLSTVHTNDAPAAVTRLRDMGVEPFLLSSTIRAVLAQRLVRRLCNACKTEYQPDESELKTLGLGETDRPTLYRAEGCFRCGNSGYDGRLGIYELMVVDAHLKTMIHNDASEHELAKYAFQNEDTLFVNGVRHVCAGLTTTEEIVRVCKQDGELDAGL